MTTPFGENSFEAFLERSPWIARISSFANLEVGWDGYAAQPISRAIVTQSRSLAEELTYLGYSIVNTDPTGDGSVILAAKKGDVGFEIEIASSTSFGVAKLRAGGNEYFDASSLEEIFAILEEEAAHVVSV